MPARVMRSWSVFSLLVVSLAQPAKSVSMKPVTTVPLPCESTFQMISPTGGQVALRCKDDTVRLVNVSSGTTEHTFAAEPPITGYNYSHDGRWFAVGLSDGSVEVVPASGAAEGKRWKSDTRRIGALEFLPDSSGIVVAALRPPRTDLGSSGNAETTGNFALRFCRADRVQFQPRRKVAGHRRWRHGDPLLRHGDLEDAA